MKRFFDFICSLLAIILLSPVLLLLSMVILIDSGRPIVFRQKRVGLNNQLFDIRKFRTMKQGTRNAPTADLKEFDHCVTRCGRFLRKTSLDELPQLFNILLGEMSFVGTRPEVPKYVSRYTPEMMATLLLPAGVTSQASIQYKDEDRLLENAQDADKTYVEQVLPGKMEYNLKSILEFSLWKDFKTMIDTVVAVVR